MLVLSREQKQSIQRKTSLRQGKDQQQCQTTCGVALGVQAQATLERGIHPCTTFGPLTVEVQRLIHVNFLPIHNQERVVRIPKKRSPYGKCIDLKPNSLKTSLENLYIDIGA